MQHDACGVGFVARTGGDADHDVIRLALTALSRLAHRGAPAALGAVDGAGLLTDIPWPLLTADVRTNRLPGRTRALGMFFVHKDDCRRGIEIVDTELHLLGAQVAWRHVPTNARAVLPLQQSSIPRVLQAIVAFRQGRSQAESCLYGARLRIEEAARRAGVRLTVVSLSTRTVAYKALVPPHALDRFYPDLAADRFVSRFAVFHQRFSTNTSADWALAQPFRVLAHNGEINTITGNRSWMQARALDRSSIANPAIGDALSVNGSDSQSLDDAVELLRHHQYSIAHAITRLMPPAWERERDLPPDVLAFHQFQSFVGEPWDGPAAVAFGDGRFVGAALDRNGFRPARSVQTSTGLIAVASEVGVLDVPDADIIERDRLGPGDILMVDLDRGAVMRTNEIHRRLAFRRPYRRIVEETSISLASASDLSLASSRPGPRTSTDAGGLCALQAAFGCSREEIDLLLKPMFADGHEAVGSMGDDVPPAALSQRARLFTDFFRQRFAQVTNPPLDPYRESSVMSLSTVLGAPGDYLDETAPRPPRIVLRSPVLTDAQLQALGTATRFAPSTIPLLFDPSGGPAALDGRLEAIAAESARAVEQGSALVVLSDRGVDEHHAPVPALLAAAAVHRRLIERGLRLRASIVVDTGHARDAHQVAVLCAFGAAAVCPWLGYATVRAIAPPDATGCDRPLARYRLALERGLLTIMSKMGVCTFASYCGSQLFEILGLEADLVARLFPSTPAHCGSVTLGIVAAAVLEHHSCGYSSRAPILEYPGLHGYRRDGEYHAANPLVVRGLQRARDEMLRVQSAGRGMEPRRRPANTAYESFKSHVYNRPPTAIRDLIELASTDARPIEHVESVESICRRFFASAMSVGALSPEAHRTIARAMNMIGARSNSGEGGEEPDRFVRRPDADLSTSEGSRTKQIASGRFGVTPAYLRSADELQIKIAQGSKPGEGGQLPALKVVPHIARLRHAQPGTPLISPPVHHDIYSIEDLAQLIFDLRTFHPDARINVKLVSSSGVGIIAAGVAKAGADAIQISGHDGGTGASPRGSIKHAGLPWEIGLSEAHRMLSESGLRSRIVLQTDGGLKTGRDIAMAAALGADEFGFGTAALVAIGCVMARQCHANTCPVGIATQREDLRGAFKGTAAMLVGYLRLVAGEVREILASLGLRSIDALVGRTDLLRARADVPLSIDLDGILRGPETSTSRGARSRSGGTAATPDCRPTTSVSKRDYGGAVAFDRRIVLNRTIANTDRAVGADIAGEIAARFGDAGLPDGSVVLNATGSAGQSFGAFSLSGMRLVLVGDANDGLGKGMHGGEVVVRGHAFERGRAEQVRVGNAALYGATGGRLFVAGRAGERFAVRNSGATAVVEGVGDHACEYMTGGIVVILGTCGRNFGSGMTGGSAYVFDPAFALVRRAHAEHLCLAPLTPSEYATVRRLIDAHLAETGSHLARAILCCDPDLISFISVHPRMPGRQQDVQRAAGLDVSGDPAPEVLSA